MQFSVTGSRYIDPTHHSAIDEALYRHLSPGDDLATGGAVGVDTYVLRTAAHLMPGVRQRVIVPSDGLGWDNGYLHLADDTTTVPGGFRERNAALVEFGVDGLLAFPLHPESHGQSRRSGTWMTIRMARRAGRPVFLYVLNPEGRA